MKTAYFMTVAALLLLTASTQAASVQCRGVDGHGHQIAVRVADITSEKNRLPAGGNLQILTLNGRQKVCDTVIYSGDKNRTLEVDCQTEKGPLSLSMKIKETNKYAGEFCGFGKNTEIAGLSFLTENCLDLSCDAKDLSN